jgi:hypothetical protein
MARVIRRCASLLFVLGLTVAGGLSPSTTTAHKPAIHPTAAVATHYVEVRIRRLHLVRPDLIQYPIAYEVFC